MTIPVDTVLMIIIICILLYLIYENIKFDNQIEELVLIHSNISNELSFLKKQVNDLNKLKPIMINAENSDEIKGVEEAYSNEIKQNLSNDIMKNSSITSETSEEDSDNEIMSDEDDDNNSPPITKNDFTNIMNKLNNSGNIISLNNINDNIEINDTSDNIIPIKDTPPPLKTEEPVLKEQKEPVQKEPEQKQIDLMNYSLEEIKRKAKQIGIKLTENKKQKSKELLIKEINEKTLNIM